MGTLAARVSAEGERGYGDASTEVISVPPGDEVAMALDSGGPTDPVLSTYDSLSPADAWDPAKGYGWVGNAPISRDRGQLDDLRRDFTLSRGEPTTLRLNVPAGRHRVYMLTGDASFPSGNTIVSSGGQVLAESGDEIIPQGRFSGSASNWTAGDRPDGRSTDYRRPTRWLLAPQLSGDAALIACVVGVPRVGGSDDEGSLESRVCMATVRRCTGHESEAGDLEERFE